MAPSRGKQQPKRKGPALDAKKPTKQNNKTASTRKSEVEGTQDDVSPIPLALQQLLLDIFSSTFPHLLNAAAIDKTLTPLLQEVKGHLYERDFAAAFGKEEYLQAYAVRWSASRALGYVEILQDTLGYLEYESGSVADSFTHSTKTVSGASSKPASKIICIGGGAGAEIVALAGVQYLVEQAFDRDNSIGSRNISDHEAQQIRESPSLDIVLVDIADWSGVTNSLHKAITTPPPLSDFASASARAASKPLISLPSSLRVEFTQQDVLAHDFRIATLLPQQQNASDDLDRQRPLLVTLMFTLNELYSASMSSTQRFLLDLTAALPRGALLLVVDSPGSYSTVHIGQSEKNYPMSWLLEHVLMTTAPAAAAKRQEAASDVNNIQLNDNAETEKNGKRRRLEDIPVWEKVLSEDSKWNRLVEGCLKYPIELENMRFQRHLYRRI